jgi:hypothetical protein
MRNEHKKLTVRYEDAGSYFERVITGDDVTFETVWNTFDQVAAVGVFYETENISEEQFEFEFESVWNTDGDLEVGDWVRYCGSCVYNTKLSEGLLGEVVAKEAFPGEGETKLTVRFPGWNGGHSGDIEEDSEEYFFFWFDDETEESEEGHLVESPAPLGFGS